MAATVTTPFVSPVSETDHQAESCIDRAAVIECIAECGDSDPESPPSTSQDSHRGLWGGSCDPQLPEKGCGHRPGGRHRSQACDKHISSARERYSAVGGALRCICRILKAKNLDSCCRPQRRRTPLLPDAHARGHERHGHERHHARSEPDSESDCCGKLACNNGEVTVTEVPSCEVPSCCTTTIQTGGTRCDTSHDHKDCKESFALNVTDLEKGEAHLEPVVLSVSGMTCAGCEMGLHRALASLPEVRHLQISLILARAAFDLDTNRMSVDQVVAYIGRVTKFRCEKITSRGQKIEVIQPKGSKSLTQQARPIGILEVKSMKDDIVQIEYDPAVLGARTLVDTAFDVPLQLAPVKPEQSKETGSKQVREDGWITLISALLTIPVLVLAWAPLPDHPVIYGSVSLALATIIQVGIAGRFYPLAFKSLVFSRLVEVDLLIVLSTSAAYLFSVIAFAYQMKGEPLSTGDFFEPRLAIP